MLVQLAGKTNYSKPFQLSETGQVRMEVRSLKRNELQKLCKTNKLKATGKNVELIERLEEHFEALPKTEGNQEKENIDTEDDNHADNNAVSLPTKSNVKKGKATKEQKASEKNAGKAKTKKKKKRKGNNKMDSDDDSALTDGIDDEKHKEYIKAKSASCSSPESAGRFQSTGNDSVFIPEKLAESVTDIETTILSSSLLQRPPLTDPGNLELKVAMISPLVRRPISLNSTHSLNTTPCTEEPGLLAYDSSSVESEDRQAKKPGPVFRRPVSLNSTHSLNTTPCTEGHGLLAYDSPSVEVEDRPTRKPGPPFRRPMSLNSTHSLNTTPCTEEPGLLAYDSSSVEVEDRQAKKPRNHSLQASFDVDRNKTVDGDCKYDLDDTISYDEANNSTDAFAMKGARSEADGTLDASSWLMRRSGLNNDATVSLSDSDRDLTDLENGSNNHRLHPSNVNETFDASVSTLEYAESDDKMQIRQEHTSDYQACSSPMKPDEAFNRRQTHVIEKACVGDNGHSTVKVQGNDRRRTFQITMVQNNTANNVEVTPFVQGYSHESSDDSSFVSCKSTESEGQDISSLSVDNYANRTDIEEAELNGVIADREIERVQNAGEEALESKNSGSKKDRRGTFLIRSSEETVQENTLNVERPSEISRDAFKDERLHVNHCVCHGTVRQSRGWRRLVLKRGLPSIQLSQTNLQKLLLRPVDKPVPIGYKDNMICGECVTENGTEASQQKYIDPNSQRPVAKTVLGPVKPNVIAKRGASASTMTGKRKWEANHVCESSPATKKSRNARTAALGVQPGLPASPEIRRARGEKPRLPRHLLEPFKPKRASMERKEDLAYARKVEEIMMSVQPGSEEEMALIMQKKSRLPETQHTL